MKTITKIFALLAFSCVLAWPKNVVEAAALPGGSLDPTGVAKYQMPLIIPPAMPKTGKIKSKMGKNIEYYEIAVRQFRQQILPVTYPTTTVWSYGSIHHPWTFNYPAFTIEAKWDKPVRVKWINDLKDPLTGNYLPHLLPVDQTLHWTNPPGGEAARDKRGTNPNAYTGPVPIITHLHGAHVEEESDGYPEAWYLPNANNIPGGYATVGTWYNPFKAKFESTWGQQWEPGTAVFQYPNDQLATTLWYHDHSLGMTRLNVYAGPAGFYLIRGGRGDEVSGLPGPAPEPANNANVNPTLPKYYEIPIVIQDRSFNVDGSLFYPDNRAFFEGLEPEQLKIPFIPDEACNGNSSDISAIWNPEFFGNMMVVNGRTWPYLEVEKRRYRFRLLNGCSSRFVILKMDNAMPFYQIGSDGGFLPEPVMLDKLLMSPAERADVIVDFTNIPMGTEIVMLNVGPDEPFGGGVPGADFDPADSETTGQVMQFRVVPAKGLDISRPPMELVLPTKVPLGPAATTRQLTLNEEESATVFVSEDADGNIVLDCDDGEAFAPKAALLGTLSGGPLLWSDDITEAPVLDSTEIWEIHNFTEDAHPIHVHLVQFEVIEREDNEGAIRTPEPWEKGWKDTVIAYPDEITRIKARFDIEGLFVWHCHILEHEDNEMMRPYRVMP
jgi:spore coat protein A